MENVFSEPIQLITYVIGFIVFGYILIKAIPVFQAIVNWMEIKIGKDRFDYIKSLAYPVISKLLSDAEINSKEDAILHIDRLKDMGVKRLATYLSDRNVRIDLEEINYAVEEALEDILEYRYGILVELNSDVTE